MPETFDPHMAPAHSFEVNFPAVALPVDPSHVLTEREKAILFGDKRFAVGAQIAVYASILMRARIRSNNVLNKPEDLYIYSNFIRLLNQQAGIPIHPSIAPLITKYNCIKPELTIPQVRTPMVTAYVRLNPEMLTGPQIAARTGMSLKAMNSLRSSARNYRRKLARKEYLGLVEQGKNPPVPDFMQRHKTGRGEGSGTIMPISVADGALYHELSAAEDPFSAAYHHVRSPLYKFHAYAWGRRTYANLLAAAGYDVCPFSKMSGMCFSYDNPMDGNGTHAYDLAIDHWRHMDGKSGKNSSLVLYIPAAYSNAHVMAGPWLEKPTKSGAPAAGTRTYTLKVMIENELAEKGINTRDLFTRSRVYAARVGNDKPGELNNEQVQPEPVHHDSDAPANSSVEDEIAALIGA